MFISLVKPTQHRGQRRTSKRRHLSRTYEQHHISTVKRALGRWICSVSFFIPAAIITALNDALFLTAYALYLGSAEKALKLLIFIRKECFILFCDSYCNLPSLFLPCIYNSYQSYHSSQLVLISVNFKTSTTWTPYLKSVECSIIIEVKILLVIFSAETTELTKLEQFYLWYYLGSCDHR